MQGVPSPTGNGFVHVLCLFLSPPLHDFEQELQDDHVDQPPFTGIKFGFTLDIKKSQLIQLYIIFLISLCDGIFFHLQ